MNANSISKSLLKMPGSSLALAILIVALFPVYCLYNRAEGFGLHHDDGLYLVTAQSLAADGTYSIKSLPTPIPQTKYPILYPLVLAPLLKIQPEISGNIRLLRMVSLVFAVAWFVLIYQFMARRYSPDFSCIVLALVMISHYCIYMSASLLPDILFSLLCLASVILIDKAEESRADWRQVVLASLVAGAAFWVSTKGIAVIFAGLLLFLMHRRWKKLLVFAGGAGVLCLPWLVWQRSIQAPEDPILRYYSKASYAAGHIFGNCSLAQATDVVGTNAVWLARGLVNLFGINLMQGLHAFIIPFGLMLLAAIGFWWSIRSRITAADLWFAIYIGMLLCWIWPPNRYQVPLFPLFLGYVGLALRVMICQCPKILRPKAIVAGLIMVSLALSGWTSYRVAQVTWEKGSPAFEINDTPDNWQATKDLCAWIGRNTQPQAVIMANLDPVVYLLTKRKSVRAFVADPYLLFYSEDKNRMPLGDVVRLRNQLLRHGITHVMLTPMNNYAETQFLFPLFEQLLRRYPGCARLVTTGKEASAQIWEINREKLSRQEPQITNNSMVIHAH